LIATIGDDPREEGAKHFFVYESEMNKPGARPDECHPTTETNRSVEDTERNSNGWFQSLVTGGNLLWMFARGRV
jgi:hypothetical protein